MSNDALRYEIENRLSAVCEDAHGERFYGSALLSLHADLRGTGVFSGSAAALEKLIVSIGFKVVDGFTTVSRGGEWKRGRKARIVHPR